MASLRKARSTSSDLVLAGGVLLIMALMVLRLPTPLIDVLVAINISIGVCLLLIAIYIPSPLTFSSFPSVLLMSTLFRLALTVATTRLILLEADAGDIITAFGTFVAGGNLVVGIVVFIIITVVQFIVIAKGAERVAEVSARFTLDAMPGKQLSIDSDLRSGLIEKAEAKRRRQVLESENQLNGALDGAMKFVKGDAIASIIIVVVNLVGGLTVGMAQRGLGFGDALTAYSILTIGDGMVAQIPALTSAMAAGLVVTRTTTEGSQNLGATIGQQFLAQPRALLLTAGMALVLAATPGFPTLTFIAIAAVLLFVSGVFANFGKQTRDAEASAVPVETPTDAMAPPLVIELSRDVAAGGIGEATQRVQSICRDITRELGVPLPPARVVTRRENERCRVRVFDVIASVRPGLVADADPIEEVLRPVLLQRAGDFLGVQEVTDLLERAARDYPALVREVSRHLGYQQIADVLRGLVAEAVPIRDLRTILESLAQHAEHEKNAQQLTELARIGLRHKINELSVGADETLRALALGPEVEAVVRAGLSPTPAGVVLSLPGDICRQLREKLGEALASWNADDGRPVLLSPADIRRHLRTLTAAELPNLRVVSFAELLPTTRIEIRAQIAL